MFLCDQIAHAMLMPSVDFRDSESLDFQVNFVMCGGLKLLLSFLTNKKLMSDAGNVMKRYSTVTNNKVTMYTSVISCTYTVHCTYVCLFRMYRYGYE